MRLLLAPASLADRRRVAAHELRPLADSLAADLSPVIGSDMFIPSEKARLSRDGGRCPRHGVLLDFDPFSPRRHRCPRCGEVFEGEAHYRWWIMSYQLWLAERAVHGALLGVLRADPGSRALAERIIAGYTDRYASYPNADNVLGPTRLFFSTYLESIWLLQLCVAIDLLESTDGPTRLGDELRDRVIVPSAALIASYDEGGSNRQSWNNAALLAAALVLGRPDDAERVVWGPSGLTAQLGGALLPDGTWYEGENYHLFAHRALWYGVQMCERAGLELDASLVDRFNAGFGAPFVGVLPDLTLPSRRDSQYAISVRQWRFAELCELGLARQEDPLVAGILGSIYGGDVPRGETGRASSAAESERNFPQSALGRADLGWRSLLFARATLPPLAAELPRSAILQGQGYAVLRRGERRDVYIALDYGHSGGGHGHPDRLNLQLAHGDVRWLDDMGTGSYVDPSLHWYRSTLAHNAPLVNGRSQARVHGALRAWHDGDEAGWVDAEAREIAPGVRFTRAVVAMRDYLVDVVEWTAAEDATVDLPVHLDAEMEGEQPWVEAAVGGGAGLEDGFAFARRPTRLTRPANAVVRWSAARGARRISAWASASHAHEWWRAHAPGPPASPAARFYWVRVRNATGRVRTVIDWSGSVRDVRVEDERVVVIRMDGGTDLHSRALNGWRIERRSDHSTALIELGGVADRPAGVERAAPSREHGLVGALARAIGSLIGVSDATHHPSGLRVPIAPRLSGGDPIPGALEIALGEPHYRRSEQSWREAGSPSAVVRLGADDRALIVDVCVRKSGSGLFAPPRERNELDNEHPDTNSDGLQLYVAAPGDASAAGWLLVPEIPPPRVRTSPIAGMGADRPIASRWEPTGDGYRIVCEIPLTDGERRDGLDFDLIVNEIAPGRERRRGQLVLSGGEGEWIYLRGDRQPRDRYLRLVLGHAV